MNAPHLNYAPKPERSGANLLALVLGGIAVMTFISCFGCLAYLSVGAEGGVRLEGNMESYAWEYVDARDLIPEDERLIAYFDETIALDSTVCIILTDRRVIQHREGRTTDVVLARVDSIYDYEDEIGTTTFEVSTPDRQLMLEIPPLNGSDTFKRALYKTWERERDERRKVDVLKEAPEGDTVDVILTDFGDHKISVIKAVRESTGLGLADAKELVESAPAPIKTDLSRDAAEALIAEIEEAGGTAELRF